MLSPPGLLGPHGLAVDADGTILFADGLSVGAVVDGVAERRHRLLVDLPTLAIGVAPFAGGLVVLGATGELLRYGDGDAPTVLADGLLGSTAIRVDGDRLLVADRANGRITAVTPDGATSTVHDGLAAPASVDRLGDGYVIGAGTAVLVIDAAGVETRVDGFGDAQGVAAIGSPCSSPTPPATSSCSSTWPPAAARSSCQARPSGRRSPVPWCPPRSPRWRPTVPAATSSAATATGRSVASLSSRAGA